MVQRAIADDGPEAKLAAGATVSPKTAALRVSVTALPALSVSVTVGT